MARDRIEQLAIANLKRVLLKSKYVIPQILENDKTPSYDGDLLLYSTEDHTKNKIQGLIPVQVKGITVDKFKDKCSYPFAWTDIENYYKDKGCLFFVVHLLKSNEEEYRIYYKEWPLLELQNLLKKNPTPRAHETITLPLREFPMQHDAINTLLFSVHNDMRKQLVVTGATQLPALDVSDGGLYEIQLMAFGEEKQKPFQILTKESRYVYKKTSNGTFPLEVGKVKICVDTEQDINVTVAEEKYYDICSTQYKEGKEIHRIGDSLEFEIVEEQLKYSIKLSNSLQKRLYDLKFLLAALENGSFEIAEQFRFDLSGLVNEKETITSWKEQYKDLLFYDEFLNKIGVKEDLRLDKLRSGDEIILNELANCVLNSKLYASKEQKSMFCVTSISNLKLLFAYDEINRTNDEYLYRLHLPQDVKVEVTLKTTEQEVVEVPFVSYVRHEKPELLGEISNLNWEQLVTEYGRLVTKHRNFYIETATLDMLEIIRQYDKKKKKELLQHAMRIQEWLMHQCVNNLSKQSLLINRLQIVSRMRLLRDEEKEELAIVLAKTRNAQIKYAAYLLLGDMINAKYWYVHLSKEEQRAIDKQPITLFKQF